MAGKIDLFLDMMFHSADQTHMWHLQTNSYALHMALGGYYDAIRLGLDDVAEKCMGYKSIRLSAKGKLPLVNFVSVTQVQKHLSQVEIFLRDLNNEVIRSDKNATQLVNAIDVIRECVAKTKYLLTLS